MMVVREGWKLSSEDAGMKSVLGDGDFGADVRGEAGASCLGHLHSAAESSARDLVRAATRDVQEFFLDEQDDEDITLRVALVELGFLETTRDWAARLVSEAVNVGGTSSSVVVTAHQMQSPSALRARVVEEELTTLVVGDVGLLEDGELAAVLDCLCVTRISIVLLVAPYWKLPTASLRGEATTRCASRRFELAGLVRFVDSLLPKLMVDGPVVLDGSLVRGILLKSHRRNDVSALMSELSCLYYSHFERTAGSWACVFANCDRRNAAVELSRLGECEAGLEGAEEEEKKQAVEREEKQRKRKREKLVRTRRNAALLDLERTLYARSLYRLAIAIAERTTSRIINNGDDDDRCLDRWDRIARYFTTTSDEEEHEEREEVEEDDDDDDNEAPLLQAIDATLRQASPAQLCSLLDSWRDLADHHLDEWRRRGPTSVLPRFAACTLHARFVDLAGLARDLLECGPADLANLLPADFSEEQYYYSQEECRGGSSTGCFAGHLALCSVLAAEALGVFRSLASFCSSMPRFWALVAVQKRKKKNKKGCWVSQLTESLASKSSSSSSSSSKSLPDDRCLAYQAAQATVHAIDTSEWYRIFQTKLPNQDKRSNNERSLAFKHAVRDLANTGIIRDETKRGKFVLCTT